MHVRPMAVSGLLLTASWLSVGLATPALAVCDSYSAACPTAAPEGDGSSTAGGGQTPSNAGGGRPSTLPFTGGELVLLTAVGVGALAGGTALVVAGRRKASPAL